MSTVPGHAHRVHGGAQPSSRPTRYDAPRPRAPVQQTEERASETGVSELQTRQQKGASGASMVSSVLIQGTSIKCDDQRPCSRCVARSEECVHVGRGPKLVKLRCEGCRQDNRKCEDARPCRHCTEQGRECVSVQRKGRGHGTRVKAVRT